jgi:hypothetical protein
MKIQSTPHATSQIAEVISDELIITDKDSGIDLAGNLYYQGFDHVILHTKNITPDFFDLKSGIAGEVLQKFSTYRVRLAIIGDFSAYESKSLRDFIRESNAHGHVLFLSSREEAVTRFSS